MPQVVVRGAGIGSLLLGPEESLVFGRAPHAALDPAPVPGRTVPTLPDRAPHVSRLVGELLVGTERVVLHWRGSGTAQLAGLFDAPGGARRVSLSRSMSTPLDDGENQLVVLLGRRAPDGGLTDLVISIDVTPTTATPLLAEPATGPSRTEAAPALARGGREWFVALALTEPWLTGRGRLPAAALAPRDLRARAGVARLHLEPAAAAARRRVHPIVSALAFGAHDDPFSVPHDGRLQNVRFAVARRAAELRLVTAADLAEGERAARNRRPPPPQSSSAPTSST